jgi:two-component system nitrogen regulation response regulator NtrX
VVPVAVPGLDERREDIPVLAAHFIEQLHQSQGLPLRELTQEAETRLQTMNWRGNVRQLKNVVERVLIMGGDTGSIELADLPNDEFGEGSDDAVVVSSALAALPLREARELFEREYLLAQINRFGGNISRTATFVGMERSALHRKLKTLGVVTSSKGGARIAEVLDDTTDVKDN